MSTSKKKRKRKKKETATNEQLTDDSEPDAETLPKKSQRNRAEADTLREASTKDRAKQDRRQRVARRHPDIEIARLLVKRGYVQKADAVEALKLQKARAKAGKARIRFLQLLVKRRALNPQDLNAVQDEIRKNTYLCDNCDARAVILVGSQSRGGACPRCGGEIMVGPASDPMAIPGVREFTNEVKTDALDSEGTNTWRPLGSRYGRGLPKGEVAFNRYLVRDELGRGAMGIVYRVTHLELNKDVALKLLIPSEDAWEHQVARFKREAAAVQKLRHDGIVPVHDFGTDGEVYYLTMDLVPGGDSLHRRLKDKDNPPTLNYRLSVIKQVARAVGHAHERGIIHRDLKPANVLLAPEGVALVADFGLAKDEEVGEGELTRTHDRLGTPLFMAPEQIRKGASTVDARADVWALGVMLFACVTGRYPFRSRTVMDLYLRILREPPDWTGEKYSAPDRRGFLRKAPETLQPARADEASDGDEKPKGMASTASSPVGRDEERTEISNRDSDGKLPKVLPPSEDDLDAPKQRAVPPFTVPPELETKGIPAALRSVVMCALAKDPDDRYPTADAFADDLERFLEGGPVHGGGPGAMKRFRQQLWRRRVLRPLALVLGLLVVASSIAWLTFYLDRKKQLEFDTEVEAAWGKAASGAEEGFKDAESALSALLRAQPDHIVALVRRGTAYSRMLAFNEGRRDLDLAEKHAQELSEGPERVELLVEIATIRAELELMDGQPRQAFDAALRGLTAAKRPVPLLVTPLALAAHALETSVALSKAEEWCARACADPTAEPELHALYARLALKRGDLATARERLQGLPDEMRHTNGDVLLVRGRLRLDEGNRADKLFGRARGAFRTRNNPYSAYLYNMGGKAYASGQWERNIAAMTAAARLAPWNSRSHYYRGNNYHNKLALAKEALDAFRSAVQLDPYHRQSRDYYIAHLLAQPDKWDEAIEFYRWEERLLWQGSNTPALYVSLVLIQQRKMVEAWEALDRSDASLKPEFKEKGLRTALARAAILRIATPEQLQSLTKLETWVEKTAEEWEAGYGDHWDQALNKVTDYVAMSWLYIGAQDYARAGAFLKRARTLAMELDQRQRSDLFRGSAQVFKARILAATGDAEGALKILESVARYDTLPPMILPDILIQLPEFKTLHETDRFQDVVQRLRSKSRS